MNKLNKILMLLLVLVCLSSCDWGYLKPHYEEYIRYDNKTDENITLVLHRYNADDILVKDTVNINAKSFITTNNTAIYRRPINIVSSCHFIDIYLNDVLYKTLSRDEYFFNAKEEKSLYNIKSYIETRDTYDIVYVYTFLPEDFE